MPNVTDFVAKRLNRVFSRGKTYVYHRPSGTRLPDLPTDHPDFIAAYRAAELAHRTQSDARARIGAADDPRRFSRADIRAPVAIDVMAYNTRQIIAFVFAARPGDTLFYHAGSLAAEAAQDAVTHEKQRYTMLMSQFHLLTLRRATVGENWHQYFAVRTDEPANRAPKYVTQGYITADEYEALTAVLERQAAVSVSRAIRDHLGISDSDARDMRTEMINRGWITNTRPPELTALGLSLLT